MLTRNVTVGDPDGLHAQLAHQLTQIAGKYTASIWIRHAGRRTSLRDPIHILALGAHVGDDITVIADGLDEADAITAICNRISTTP